MTLSQNLFGDIPAQLSEEIIELLAVKTIRQKSAQLHVLRGNGSL
jgi:hypothetical protein